MNATVVGGIPAYPQQPPDLNPPPYMMGGHAAVRSAGNKFSRAAFGLAVLALLILPIVFGPLAVGSAVIALRKGERRGRLALILAIAGMVLGFAFGVIRQFLLAD